MSGTQSGEPDQQRNVGTTYPFDPDWCMRPGVHLQEMMDHAGLKGRMGVTMVAKGSHLDESVIEGILSGEVEITEDIAQHLAWGTQPLAISAQFWLNVERTYRAALAAGKTDISADYDEAAHDA